MTSSPRERLIVPVAITVAVVWISSLASGVLTQNFTPFEVSTPVMILLSGYTFGVQIVKGTNDKPQ